MSDEWQKVFRVYWRLCQMSKHVASKGNMCKKTYNKTDMQSDFPPETDPKEAIETIYEQHGFRPDKPLHTEHSFAEIVTLTVFCKRVTKPEPEEKAEQPNLV